LGAALFVADAAAQRRPPPPQGPGNRQQLELRVRERFAAMMKERLGLTAEQSDALGQTIESYQEQRQRLVSDEQALRRRTEAILLEQAPTEEEARSILNRMRELREEEARLFAGEQEALQQILTPVQLVRFHAMREQLGQRIQQLRGRMGPMGPGRPPGGGPFPGAGRPDEPWERRFELGLDPGFGAPPLR
jgi:Spy/CpxP family protein refolding chaperone